ncbi:MAG: hypothetical protein K0B00_10920 [Rhodobacteraceae bacterium]|nr:hypothetical protein [Paracoccaceae bacterium]
MGYDLAIGDRSYARWSLRGWLLFAHGGIAVTTQSGRLDQSGRLYSPDFARLMATFAPARLARYCRLSVVNQN